MKLEFINEPTVQLGEWIQLRIRIASHDAHYAGELVDGAKMLQFFGDVATELLVRWDGDEGLFRAYDRVDFLGPVYSGDTIEVRGRIVKAGKTSRTMEFEAWKVASLLSRGHASVAHAVSACGILKTPLLICSASGTCVTPLELQRFQTIERGSGR
jgi:3-aminobutyryl-CoA ammonia-lyase